MRSISSRLTKALATVLVMVMAVVPVFEALLCTIESPAAHAVAEGDGLGTVQDESHRSDLERGQAHASESCAHNHCHHPSAFIPLASGLIGEHQPHGLISAEGRSPPSGVRQRPSRPPWS